MAKQRPFYGAPLSKCDDLEFLRDAVSKLWIIIDDMELTPEKKHDRWRETGIDTDGSELFCDMRRMR